MGGHINYMPNKVAGPKRIRSDKFNREKHGGISNLNIVIVNRTSQEGCKNLCKFYAKLFTCSQFENLSGIKGLGNISSLLIHY